MALEISHPEFPLREQSRLINASCHPSRATTEKAMPAWPAPSQWPSTAAVPIPAGQGIPLMRNFGSRTSCQLSENSVAPCMLPTPSSFCPLSFPSLFLFPLLYLYRHFPPINSNSLNPILASASQRTQDLDYTNSLASRPFTVWIYSLIAPRSSPLLLDKAFKDSLYISLLLLL